MIVMDILCRYVSGVESLQHDNSWILPYFPGKLSISDIRSIDSFCVVLKKAISEATCGSPDIQANSVSYIDTKISESLGQLKSSP